MFDERSAAGEPAGSTAGAAAATSDRVESVLMRFAGMVPGAGLADVIERLVSPLLVRAPGADDASRAPGPGLFDGVVEPSERMLTEAAGALMIDGERGVGALVELGADGLSELMAACGRLAGWAQWAQAVAAACLALCPEMRGLPSPPPRRERDEDREEDGEQDRAEQGGAVREAASPGDMMAGRWNATGEVACRLGVSRTRASQLVDRGLGLLDGRLAPIEGLHRVGLLDESKTTLLVRRLEGEPARVAEAVQARVLGRAAHRTRAQLGRDVDRALTSLDPEGVSRRTRRNTAQRHVSRPRQAGTGVCEMRMLMPRSDAFLVDATLDAIAASARAVGDQRSLGQLRADALVAMSLHTLRSSRYRATTPRTAGTSGGGGEPAAVRPIGPADAAEAVPTAPPDPRGSAGPVGAAGLVGAAGSVGAGAGSEASADAADAAAPAEPVRPMDDGPIAASPMPDGVPLEGLLTALSDLVDRTGPWWMPSGADPVPLPPGLKVNVDVIVPLDHLTDVLEPRSSRGGPPRTTGISDAGPPGNGALDARPGIADPVGVAAGPPGAASSDADRPGGGPSVHGAPDANLISGVDLLPGRAEVPGASMGTAGRSAPVPAAVARALAAGGTWRRLVTDPLSGAVVDAGRSRYRPPAAMADLVRVRDSTCTHPGCDAPARACDLDHIVPWVSGGTTSLDNLTCLCRAHHRLKHTPGWSLTRARDGALVWRTPTGARYRRASDGSITMLPRRTGPRQEARPAARVPDVLARAVTPAVLNRLRKGLADAALSRMATSGIHDDSGRSPDRAPVVATRGPLPGHNPGDFESAPYPQPLHALGLAPLLDAIPPF